MAVTYGSSNIGSNSGGGIGLYPVSVSAGGDLVDILTANFTTNIVSAVTSGGVVIGVPLSSLQCSSLSTLLAALRAAATGEDTLATLRKLVGVLSLTDGVAVTLSVSSVGAVHTLQASPDVAAQLLVYVPNSAASGPFTGVGSEDGPGGGAGGGRPEFVANVPGLYLQGVACLVAPNFGGAITIVPAQCGGFAQTAGATATRSFRVEKTTVAAPAAVGAGSLLFDVDFAVGANSATLANLTPANYTIGTGELLRIVNPLVADAALADVAISLVGTL